MVSPTGIEPVSLDSKSIILSVELRGHVVEKMGFEPIASALQGQRSRQLELLPHEDCNFAVYFRLQYFAQRLSSYLKLYHLDVSRGSLLLPPLR